MAAAKLVRGARFGRGGGTVMGIWLTGPTGNGAAREEKKSRVVIERRKTKLGVTSDIVKSWMKWRLGLLLALRKGLRDEMGAASPRIGHECDAR